MEQALRAFLKFLVKKQNIVFSESTCIFLSSSFSHAKICCTLLSFSCWSAGLADVSLDKEIHVLCFHNGSQESRRPLNGEGPRLTWLVVLGCFYCCHRLSAGTGFWCRCDFDEMDGGGRSDYGCSHSSVRSSRCLAYGCIEFGMGQFLGCPMVNTSVPERGRQNYCKRPRQCWEHWTEIS